MSFIDVQWLANFATPAELIASGYEALTTKLEADLLDRIRKMPPAFFEAVVVDVMIRLGYGGGRPHMGQAIGRTCDGGIDGVIKEDALGLDIVYLQAKRYAEHRTVGRSAVQMFAGSLDGVGANKGVLITTASFTTGARKYVTSIQKRIVLIGGSQLARLMVENEVGVKVLDVYKIRNIDEDYFAEPRRQVFALPPTVDPTGATAATLADWRAAAGPQGGPPVEVLEAARWVGLRSRRPAARRGAPPQAAAQR